MGSKYFNPKKIKWGTVPRSSKIRYTVGILKISSKDEFYDVLNHNFVEYVKKIYLNKVVIIP